MDHSLSQSLNTPHNIYLTGDVFRQNKIIFRGEFSPEIYSSPSDRDRRDEQVLHSDDVFKNIRERIQKETLLRN